MSPTLAALIAGLVGGSPQTPPIFNPGAPGAAPRVISVDEAVALSRSGHVEADVRFMQHMLVHHAQAVEMVELLKSRGASPVVKRLGERIAQSQEAEMELMQEWLMGRGLPLAAPDPHAGHHGHAADPNAPVMPGMLSPAQMAELAAAEGAEFDRLFLQGMTRHHQGALDMVEALLAELDTAEDPMLSDFASSVTADQSAEILRMQSILSEL